MYTWGPIQRSTVTPPSYSAWLLDTFTAANGTSPLSPHVLDVYPTGMDNWKYWPADPDDFGVITGNALVVETGGGDIRAIIQNYNAGETDIALSLPFLLVMAFDLGTTGSYFQFRLAQGAGYASDANIIVNVNGDAYVTAIGETNWYEPAFPYPNIGSGAHKVGLYISADETVVLADGSELDNAAAVDHRPFVRYVTVDMFPDDITPCNGSISSVAVYTGLTLAEATALTT